MKIKYPNVLDGSLRCPLHRIENVQRMSGNVEALNVNVGSQYCQLYCPYFQSIDKVKRIVNCLCDEDYLIKRKPLKNEKNKIS